MTLNTAPAGSSWPNRAWPLSSLACWLSASISASSRTDRAEQTLIGRTWQFSHPFPDGLCRHACADASQEPVSTCIRILPAGAVGDAAGQATTRPASQGWRAPTVAH